MKAIKKATLILMVLAVLLSFSTAVSAATKKEEATVSTTTSAAVETAAVTEETDKAAEDDTAEKDKDDTKLNYSFSEKTIGNAELIANEEVLTDNGQFRFIAVTTRSGDVFYVIIDNTKSENNVYFLNDVDTYDLQALLNKDEDGNTVETEVQTDTDEENEETAEKAETQEKQTDSSTDSSDSSLLILVGIIILGGIGFAIFKLKKGGFGKKKAETDYIDDDFDDEEEINEDKEMVTA